MREHSGPRGAREGPGRVCDFARVASVDRKSDEVRGPAGEVQGVRRVH
jgi:hypothetical protein